MIKIILLTLFGLTFTQTNISGTIQGTLTSDGNPYMMIGDVICDDCIIDEGVLIKVAGNYRINVNSDSHLNVNGTKYNPVVIESLSGLSGSWVGINMNDTSHFYGTHLDLSDGIDCIMAGANSYVSIEHSKISNCDSDGLHLESNSQETNGWSVKNNIIIDCENGINLYGQPTANYPHEIINNTITSGGCGIQTSGQSGMMVDVNSNIISDNGLYGLCMNGGYIDYQRIKHNNFYENYSGAMTYDYSVFGIGCFGLDSCNGTNLNGDPSDINLNIFSNPQMESDFTLMESSPCIDAGDFLLPYDDDGTIADIGALPYGYSINDAIYGCTYSNATNYNSDATIDNGSCEFAIMGDFNNDGQLNVVDIVSLVNIILGAVFSW